MTDELVPFGEDELPRSQVQWTEAHSSLETLLVSQAATNGIELIREKEVRRDCSLPDGTVMRFVVFWPSGQDRINILAPAKGKAANQ